MLAYRKSSGERLRLSRDFELYWASDKTVADLPIIMIAPILTQLPLNDYVSKSLPTF
jgi:hypothetical protein